MNWDKVADSGKRQEFETGARRDTDEGKPRFDLIPEYPLERLATHMANGAKKYGDHNWRRGMPLERFYGSALRHIYAWAQGDTREDHLAAAAFNIFGIIYIEQEIRMGRLDWDLANKGPMQYEGPEEMVEEVMDLYEYPEKPKNYPDGGLGMDNDLVGRPPTALEIINIIDNHLQDHLLWHYKAKDQWIEVEPLRIEWVGLNPVFVVRDDVGNIYVADNPADFRIE